VAPLNLEDRKMTKKTKKRLFWHKTYRFRIAERLAAKKEVSPFSNSGKMKKGSAVLDQK
jgi:hypothetical protein